MAHSINSNFKHPPKAVEKTLNAVYILLRKKTPGSWNDVLKIVKNNARFRTEIRKFETGKVSAKLRPKLLKKYINDAEWTFEAVNTASKVAGPLVLWVKSQVKYSQLLDEKQPMQRDIEKLKKVMSENERHIEEQSAAIEELEDKNMGNKAEYARELNEIHELKKKMQAVEQRVDEKENIESARIEKMERLIKTRQLEYVWEMKELGVSPTEALLLWTNEWDTNMKSHRIQKVKQKEQK